MNLLQCIIATSLCLDNFASSFSLLETTKGGSRTKRMMSRQEDPALQSHPSRRAAVSRTTAWLANSLLMVPSLAFAIADDNTTSALRLVRSSIKKLKATESLIDANDYQSLQQVFRSPPVSNIRKACTTLARGDEQLQKLYGTFIADLERLDTTAMTALRGRTIPETELSDRYQAMLAALEAFEASASKAASSLSEQVQAL